MLFFSTNKGVLFMTNQNENLRDEEEGGRSLSRGKGDVVFLCGMSHVAT